MLLILDPDVGLRALSGSLPPIICLSFGTTPRYVRPILSDLDLAPVIRDREVLALLLGRVFADRLVDDRTGRTSGRCPPPAIDREVLVQERPWFSDFALSTTAAHIHGARPGRRLRIPGTCRADRLGVIARRRQTRLAQPREDHAQHLCRVGDCRPDGRAQIAAQPLLVDDDGAEMFSS